MATSSGAGGRNGMWFLILTAVLGLVHGGLTDQYIQFNALLSNWSDLNILAFPCNQFGLQEPGKDATEILNCLQYVRPGNGYKLHSRIQMMQKCNVNGDGENPIYTYLKKSCPPFEAASFRRPMVFWQPIHIRDITWNFEKFLVSDDGLPRFRIHPRVEPLKLERLIAALKSGDEGQMDAILKDLDETGVPKGEHRRSSGNNDHKTTTGKESKQAGVTENNKQSNGDGNMASKFWACPYIIVLAITTVRMAL